MNSPRVRRASLLAARRTTLGGHFGVALACSLACSLAYSLAVSGEAVGQSGNWSAPAAGRANYASTAIRLSQPQAPREQNRAPNSNLSPLSGAEKLPSERGPAVNGATGNSRGPLLPPAPPRDSENGAEPLMPPRAMAGGNQAGGALVLAEAEQLALAQHPALIEAQARIQAAQGQWLQAGLYPNPIVGYSGQQLGSRGQAEQEGVVMQGELVLGGKLRLNRAVAEQQIVQAEMEYAGRQLRVLTNVRKTFYAVLVAQRRLDLNDQLVAVGGKGLQAAETLFQAKEVGRADVLQAKIEAQQARILQFNARNRSAAAWRELAAAMGREDLGSRPLEGDVSDDGREYEWESMRQRLLGSSPELAVALAGAQRAQAALARARVEPIPNLTIQGIVQRDATTDSTNGALQATMPIPVFNRNQGNIRAAEGEWIAAEQAVRRLELDLQSRLAPVFERYRNAKQQVERYREEILPNAKETLELVQASYEAGESSYLSLLTAQRTYFQTNLAYLDALRELWSAIWEMEGLLVNP